MQRRRVDEEIQLVPYYPNYATALVWYQDRDVCRQVDNRDAIYDLDLLKAMYKFLDQRGDLFYIKYRNRLCGDVCLQRDGQCYSNLNHTSAAHTTPPVTGVLPLCTRLRRVRRNNPPWRSL